MPGGKAAGERCVQLTPDNRCALFGSPDRPGFCSGFAPAAEVCGQDRADALLRLTRLEAATRPG